MVRSTRRGQAEHETVPLLQAATTPTRSARGCRWRAAHSTQGGTQARRELPAVASVNGQLRDRPDAERGRCWRALMALADSYGGAPGGARANERAVQRNTRGSSGLQRGGHPGCVHDLSLADLHESSA